MYRLSQVFQNYYGDYTQGPCRRTISKFPDSHENVVAVASNDVSVTLPVRQAVLLSHGSCLFTLAF
jgi:hypothetical protein